MDYLDNRDIIAASRNPPTIYFCILPVLSLSSYYVYTIKFFYKMISHNFDRNGNFIEPKSEHAKSQ